MATAAAAPQVPEREAGSDRPTRARGLPRWRKGLPFPSLSRD